MNIEFFVLMFVAILHIAIYKHSTSPGRKRKLVMSFSILGASIVLFLVGLLLGLGGNYQIKDIAVAFIYAPVYLPVLSFSVYLSNPN